MFQGVDETPSVPYKPISRINKNTPMFLVFDLTLTHKPIKLKSQENRRKARKPLGFRQEVPTANLFALIFNRDADLQYSSVVFMLFRGCY
jgi:hypothetical protein